MASKVIDYTGSEGVVEDGNLCYVSRENPNGKFDWFKVGGRFDGYLKIRESRQPSFLGKLFGKKPTARSFLTTAATDCADVAQTTDPSRAFVRFAFDEQSAKVPETSFAGSRVD